MTSALLALADGSVFHGLSVGADGESVGEVVFNTAMTGYQEILTDPSYARQLITLTHPHIGNTGCNDADDESRQVFAAGLIVRDVPRHASSWRSEVDLPLWLRRRGVVAIAEIDTRRLTRILRDDGAQGGCLVAGDNIDIDRAIDLARKFSSLKGMDLAREVSCRQAYDWADGVYQLDQRAFARPESQFNVVAYDFGIKYNILRLLVDRGCSVRVVPAQTAASDVLAMKPDGVLLSNGPGDPEPCDYAITAIGELLDARMPTFGICLGHQLLGLAVGAKTVKMKFGHHGANHPVQELASGRVMITSQNHGFSIDESTLPESVVATHRSLFDGSLQGIRFSNHPAFGFQGHPEAGPGPQDIQGLFDDFTEMMRTHREENR